ncbi:peroxiredoxin [Jannaschia seohaensis]|uniref:Glutathione-dependent peroxiredoxin n=1 Tax=Jannaschia seohaensis TaxID=475081 RepID=A0A2Y9AY16_9RHOB|nr:peroxiredoxin [Jannaschia seohaensis]PWJ16941.1 peroxiredoxin [Jannaschia seohaensis]SSA48158.1 Peroxiredoxin [Jannaschia seohaensis]
MTLKAVPDVVFHTRVRNDALEGPNPFEWKDMTTSDLFGGKRVVLFAVPGAFTPACSESHLPGYEANFDAFKALGVTHVYCLSVNDAFVLRQWALSRNIERVIMLPDGNGDFSRMMGMLVKRTAQGMGYRSWRYSMFAVDGMIEKLFIEPGLQDNPGGVPVDRSDAETMLGYLRSSH